MQQMSVKAAIREWGDDAIVAGEKEMNQLQWRETFAPRRMSELTDDQRSRFYRVICSSLRSAQVRPRQEWSQVETYSGAM